MGHDDTERRGDADLSLADLRAEIEEIDEELIDLIAKRTYAAESVARVKERDGIPTTDEGQERQVLDRAAETAERFDLDPLLVKSIFRLLIELNKVEQRESR